MRPPRLAALTVPILVAAALGATTATPAAAGTPAVSARTAVERYVALGDSFAAGPLVPLQTGRPVGCLRSDHNYPSIVADELAAATFTDVSCSGATTRDFTAPQDVGLAANPPQLDALTVSTDLVTFTIGGNDIGFAEIVNECTRRSPADPGGAACRDHFTDGGTDVIAGRIADTAPRVAEVLTQIARRSPDARVVVVGYPAILPDTGPGCFPLIPFSPGDVAYLREVEKSLNAMIADAAAEAGADFVDTYTPTIGHDVCTLPGIKWVEGLVPTAPAAPVHPNALGMRAMAEATLDSLSDRR